ncbi:MAG: rod shape-determining protein RodA [Pseudomonadota bacterium]
MDRPYDILYRLWHMPWALLLLLAILAGIGVGALYSVGEGWQPWALKQLVRFGVCFALLLVLAVLPIGWLHKLSVLAYILGIGLLVAVIFFGDQQMGAKRWLQFGGFNLQPSEFVKIALVMILASYYQQMTIHELSKLRFALVPLLLIAVPMFLVLQQPDLGTALLIAALGVSIMFVAGTSIWVFLGGGVMAAIAAPLAWFFVLHDYQRQRILTFLDPESDRYGAGYHILQSIIAIGSGGLTGRGFMQGTQTQLDFLPEKHTDFIFTAIAEEWGFFGVLAISGVVLLIVAFGIFSAMQCRSVFGRLLCYGVSINMGLYVFVNMAMISGLIPVVGVPLPLISYGGSVMMAVLVGYGLLCACTIDRKVQLQQY